MQHFNNPLMAGLGAGIVTAVLYSSLATGSAAGLLLFYLAPLPAFIAGLGWGMTSALVALIASSVLTAFLLSPMGALALFASVTLPVVLVSHFVFLYRGLPALRDEQSNVTAAAPAVEWYPIGHLLLLLAAIAGTLAALGVLMLGPSHEAYVALINSEIDTMIEKGKAAGVFKPLTPEEAEGVKRLIAAVLPASSALLWLLITVCNLWLAGHVVRLSGQLRRPWPDLGEIRLPVAGALAFLLLIAVSVLLSDLPGLLLSGYAAALAGAFMLLGLAIIHHVSRRHPLRGLILFATYAATILIGWGALILILVGLADQLFNLRKLQNSRPV